MNYYSVRYEVWVKPWFRPARRKLVSVAFAAEDVYGLLRLSRDHLRTFGRQQARFVDYQQIEPGQVVSFASDADVITEARRGD